MKKRFWIDVIALFVILVLATGITLIIKPKFIISTFLFYGVPIIYFGLKEKFNWKKILLAGFVGTLIVAIADFVINANGGWWASEDKLLIPYRIFGLVNIEELLWLFLFFTFVIVTYEYFVERKKTKKISRNFKWLIVMLIATLIGVLFLYFATNAFYSIKYVYLIWVLIYGVPILIYVLIKRKSLIRKVAQVTIPLFIFTLLHEMTALKTGLWTFPGEYIGTVTLLGISFPFEEFFFFIILGAAICVAYYEFFVDDMK